MRHFFLFEKRPNVDNVGKIKYQRKFVFYVLKIVTTTFIGSLFECGELFRTFSLCYGWTAIINWSPRVTFANVRPPKWFYVCWRWRWPWNFADNCKSASVCVANTTESWKIWTSINSFAFCKACTARFSILYRPHLVNISRMTLDLIGKWTNSFFTKITKSVQSRNLECISPSTWCTGN